jgi:two-component system sensor histidine kinase/response regulator
MIADTLIDNPGPECDVADTQDLPDAAEIVPGWSANVLFAEDNEVNQEIAHEYLVRLGCTVTIVQNGREAVDRFTDGAFDIVFMDVQMPEMDGIEATRRIRDIEAKNGSRRTPIIAATAHAFQEDREKCILAGMDDFLSKPYTGKDITPLLNRWLDRRHPHSEETMTPVSPATAEPEVALEGMLDSATIAQLRTLDSPGEDRIVRKVANIFIETTPPQLQKLQNHVAAGDFAAIMLIAHSLKTGAANVAALTLSERFRALEHAAQEEESDTCIRLIEEISNMYEDVSAALRLLAGTNAPDRRTA